MVDTNYQNWFRNRRAKARAVEGLEAIRLNELYRNETDIAVILETLCVESSSQLGPGHDDRPTQIVSIKPADRVQDPKMESIDKQIRDDSNLNSRTTFHDNMMDTSVPSRHHTGSNKSTNLVNEEVESQDKIPHEIATSQIEGKQSQGNIIPSGLARSSVPKPSIINRIKAYVEDLTQETWDWWPLKPCHRELDSGHVQIKWHCVSTDRSSVYTLLIQESGRHWVMSMLQPSTKQMLLS